MDAIKTAGIILAAGASRRFGSPKQLAGFRGKPILQWVMEAAVQSELNRIVLVLGHAHDQILNSFKNYLRDSRICTILNHSYASGQSSSVRLGLARVRDDCHAVMFLLSDQPLVDSKLINRLIAVFRKSEKAICVPVFEGKRGNPTIFGRKHFETLMLTEGDRGGRDLIGIHTDDVLEVETRNPYILLDIDTPEDLARLS